MSFCLRLVAQGHSDMGGHRASRRRTTRDGVYFDEETYQLQQAMLEALR